MSTYTTYFIRSLQKYCNGFPANSNLPDHFGSQSVGTEWDNALRINYGSGAVEEVPVPLHSVFEFLKTGEANASPFGFYPLSLEEKHIFPAGEKGKFDDLVTGFKSEWPKLLKLKPEAFGDTLLYLSKKYFSNTGFSPRFPHISLHEHLKTTAALADCLGRSENRQILLVGAGLDNIQGFCYDIVSSKAAKSLKGRSFFLQMLLDTMLQEIIAHPVINASLGHVIYARGGKMYLLLPGRSDSKDSLQKISVSISENFWQHFKASLHGFLEFEEIDPAESNPAKEAWQRLDTKIKYAKNRRWSHLFTFERFDLLFSPIAEGGTNLDASQAESGQVGKKMCRVTGEIIDNPGLDNILEEDGDTGQKIYVSDFVKFQATLAEGIRDAEQYYWLESNTEQSVQKSFFTGSVKFVSLPDDRFSGRSWNHARNDFKRNIRWSINPSDNFLPDQPEEISYGFVFYGGNDQATVFEKNKTPPERIKFFHELAGLE
ncbi:MAG: hypothetical protein ABMA02_16645 [Saprospiraceae bacterium]